MITKQEYVSYIFGKYEREYLQSPCWHCKEKIHVEVDYFCIQKKMTHRGSAWIYFHSQCFTEVAGKVYDFDNSTFAVLNPPNKR